MQVLRLSDNLGHNITKPFPYRDSNQHKQLSYKIYIKMSFRSNNVFKLIYHQVSAFFTGAAVPVLLILNRLMFLLFVTVYSHKL